MHITLRKHNRHTLRISGFFLENEMVYMSKSTLDDRFKE